MLLTRMDLLSHRFVDKMNNNIGRLHYDSYDDDSGDSRMHGLSSSTGNSRTGTPISPIKRKFEDVDVGSSRAYESEQMAKMSCMFSSHLRNPVDGDTRQEPWIHVHHHHPFEHTSSTLAGLHAGRLYPPFSIYAMEQPLALTKASMDAARPLPLLGAAERQQNRPSVITCAPASNRTCNLSNCHMSPSGSLGSAPSGLGSAPSSTKSKGDADAACDPVIEEHFRRSLGNIYQEPEASNSVSITGSVDDHFAQALGETWLQIQARGSRSPESTS